MENGIGLQRGPDPREQSIAELVKAMSEHTSHLVRDEVKLATMELKEKGKKAGLGIGMFGGAGVVALYGAGALVAAFIMLLGQAMDAWGAALVVAGVLFALAAVLALIGKKEVTQAIPPAPEEAIGSIKADIGVVKEKVHH